MNRKTFCFILMVAFTVFGVSSSLPCSTFCQSGGEQVVFGRNFDWMIDDGLIVVNKRNVPKTAFVFPPEKPAKWTSRYGSVTFNQYGREMPMDGMNEAGLVVASMSLEATSYPPPDGRPAVYCLGWIQYQLDNFSTVDEVIRGSRSIRVDPKTPIPCHYLVCDKRGQSAIIEYIDGQMAVYTTCTLPVAALTNSTYEDSLEYYQKRFAQGLADQDEKSMKSLNRFTRVASRLNSYHSKENASPVDYAFGTLSSVTCPRTQWSIVYDVSNKRIHYKTRQFSKVKTIDLGEFDFSPETPVRILNVNTPGAGDVTSHFENYSLEKNRALIFSSFRKTSFLSAFPDQVLEALAMYPENMKIVNDPAFQKSIQGLMNSGKK